jgi:transcriptional regulator with XRE-family HTH domain
LIVIKGVQVRMARAALRLSTRELARLANLSPTTIVMLESDRIEPRDETLAAIQAVLERRGIIFVDSDTPTPGVKIKLKAKRSR